VSAALNVHAWAWATAWLIHGRHSGRHVGGDLPVVQGQFKLRVATSGRRHWQPPPHNPPCPPPPTHTLHTPWMLGSSLAGCAPPSPTCWSSRRSAGSRTPSGSLSQASLGDRVDNLTKAPVGPQALTAASTAATRSLYAPASTASSATGSRPMYTCRQASAAARGTATIVQGNVTPAAAKAAWYAGQQSDRIWFDETRRHSGTCTRKHTSCGCAVVHRSSMALCVSSKLLHSVMALRGKRT
jgi:hypothetical protein